MYFTITTLAILAGLAAAVPTTDISNKMDARGSTSAQCGYQFHPTLPYVGVYMPHNLMPSAQGTGVWGGGFIDNLRGSETAPSDYCNPIGWQAEKDAAGTGLVAVFNVEIGCSGSDVANALHAASGVWVICADDIGADEAQLASLGSNVAGLLAPFITKE
jgi:hypothetical protein